MGAFLSLLPKVFPYVATFISVAEQLFGPGKGADKKKFVVEAVKAVLPIVEGVAGKDLVDDAAFASAVGQLIDGAVGLVNARIKAA